MDTERTDRSAEPQTARSTCALAKEVEDHRAALTRAVCELLRPSLPARMSETDQEYAMAQLSETINAMHCHLVELALAFARDGHATLPPIGRISSGLAQTHEEDRPAV
jgi:hypothetical protein